MVVKDIKQKVADGSLQAGNPMGSERELCQYYGVSRATLRKVWTALEQEGLIKRIQGKGTFIREVSSQKTERIGVVLNAQGPYWPLCRNLILGIQDAIFRHDYSLALGYSWSSPNKEVELINRFSQEADGFIVWYQEHPEVQECIESLLEQGKPVVLVDRMAAISGVSYVGSDNFGGAYAATSHLISLGHRRIAFAHNKNHSLTISTIRDRSFGYATALSEAQLTPPPILSLPILNPDVIMEDLPKRSEMKSTVETLQAYIRTSGLPTAFCCETDYVAVNLLLALKILGIQPGREVSITGFDNSEICLYMDPPLTTVAQDGYAMGSTAVDVLMAMLKGNCDGAVMRVIPTQLIKRDSSARVE